VQKWEACFGWQVAAPGGRWRVVGTQGEAGNRMIGWGASGRGATAWRPWANGYRGAG